MADAKKKITVTSPVGRLIHESLFKKEAFTSPGGQPGIPKYKVEMAFDPEQVQGKGTLEDSLIEAIVSEWGPGAEDMYLDGKITVPLKDGDTMAANRVANGKGGDAYEGKIVIRADTQFNHRGDNAEGGLSVYDLGADGEAVAVDPLQHDCIYRGIYGRMSVSVGCYLDNSGRKATKFYLNAFQKTSDGDAIASGDKASAFAPMAAAAGAARTTARG